GGVGEMEAILVVARGRGRGGLQYLEVVGGRVIRRVPVRDLGVPEISLIGPRTQPVVLVDDRPRAITGIRARVRAHAVELGRGQEDTGLPGVAGAATAT